MSLDSTRKRWREVVAALAAVTLAHTLYFDWSDVWVFTALMGVFAVSSVRWPRSAAAATGLSLSAVLIGHLVEPDLSSWPEARGVAAGQTWTSVRERLGSPTHEAITFAAARELSTGHAVPSPLRYRHRGPVAVFVRGEYAFWVFHDRERVTGTFIGGS